MNGESRRNSIIRLHKRWADGYTLISQVLILLLFVGIHLLVEQSGLGARERTEAFVLLAAIVLATVVWQAVGLGIARVHMIMSGIDLEPNATPRKRPSGRS